MPRSNSRCGRAISLPSSRAGNRCQSHHVISTHQTPGAGDALQPADARLPKATYGFHPAEDFFNGLFTNDNFSGRLPGEWWFRRSVKIWDLPSGRLRATLDGHRGAVWGLSLKPEGTLRAS